MKESTEELVTLGAELRKFNIAVDVVNFGEEVVNTEKLDAFISSLNNENEQNSRLVTVPPGPYILSDMIRKSPIILGNAGAAAAAQAGAGSEVMEVDPNMDPELALAIRLSLEEDQRRRQQQQESTTPASSAPTKEKDEDDEELLKELDQTNKKPNHVEDEEEELRKLEASVQ